MIITRLKTTKNRSWAPSYHFWLEHGSLYIEISGNITATLNTQISSLTTCSVISRSTVNIYKFPHTYQTLSVTTFHGARWLWPNMEHCKDSLIHHSWATLRTSQTKGKWANRRNSYKCGRNFRFSHLGTETSRPSVLNGIGFFTQWNRSPVPGLVGQSQN